MTELIAPVDGLRVPRSWRDVSHWIMPDLMISFEPEALPPPDAVVPVCRTSMPAAQCACGHFLLREVPD